LMTWFGVRGLIVRPTHIHASDFFAPRYRSVIRVTPSFGKLWFNAFMRWAAAGSRNGGGYGDAAMSRNLGNPGLYDEGMIDHRNARPLTIAFATIVMVWMLAFGIVSVSAQLGAQSHHTMESVR
jgi:hypothetical protein